MPNGPVQEAVTSGLLGAMDRPATHRSFPRLSRPSLWTMILRGQASSSPVRSRRYVVPQHEVSSFFANARLTGLEATAMTSAILHGPMIQPSTYCAVSQGTSASPNLRAYIDAWGRGLQNEQVPYGMVHAKSAHTYSMTGHAAVVALCLHHEMPAVPVGRNGCQ